MAQASGSKSIPRTTLRLPEIFSDIAQQILAPATCPAVVPVPNLIARQVVPRKYVRVLDYEAPVSGQFSVVMSPDLFLPGFVTNSLATVIPVAPGRLDLAARYVEQLAVAAPGNHGVFEGKFSSAADHLLARTAQITDGLGTTREGFNFVTTSNINWSVVNKTGYTVTCDLWFLVTATNQWTLQSSISNLSGYQTAGASGTNITAISLGNFTGIEVGNMSKGSLTLQASCGTGQHTSAAEIAFAPAFAKRIDQLKITDGRVISMSMKITNTSSALSRGGNISIGRVPSSFNPYSNISLSMSRLPTNRRYQDAAETGGYAFWLPEQSDEWDFDSIERKKAAYIDSNYLLAHLNGLPAGASFRLTFAWSVEFYTDSEDYTKLDCPVISPAWTDVQRLLMQMDAACCNPESASIFKRFLNSGVRSIQGARDHYYANQETYDQLLALAKRIGLMAL